MLAADNERLEQSFWYGLCCVSDHDHTKAVHHPVNHTCWNLSKNQNHLYIPGARPLIGCSPCYSALDKGCCKGAAETQSSFCCPPLNTEPALSWLCRHGQQTGGRMHQPRLPLNHSGSRQGVRLLRLNPSPSADKGGPAQAAAAGLPKQAQGADHSVR